jgi:hypothetical protein
MIYVDFFFLVEPSVAKWHSVGLMSRRMVVRILLLGLVPHLAQFGRAVGCSPICHLFESGSGELLFYFVYETATNDTSESSSSTVDTSSVSAPVTSTNSIIAR